MPQALRLQEGLTVSTIITQRYPAGPTIQLDHVDGPLLTCSDGTLHWLTLLERLMLRIGATSVERLDAQYRRDVPARA